MTFIAENGGRTVTNCTVYERRKVYEMTASAVLDVCQSQPGGEVETTGKQVTQDIVYHVIADSEDLARTLFKERWGNPFLRHTLITVKVLFVIDAEIKRTND